MSLKIFNSSKEVDINLDVSKDILILRKSNLSYGNDNFNKNEIILIIIIFIIFIIMILI
jgi:hypothetical protein